MESLGEGVLDTWGVAEQMRQWPAQKLLDYGNAALAQEPAGKRCADEGLGIGDTSHDWI